jgi:hypothetical protein
VVVLLLTVGHSLLLTMDQGSAHRTGLDLLAAGALLALGSKELLERSREGEEPPAWTRQLNRFSAFPLPLLIAVGVGIELASPDDLFLFAKSAGAILAAGLGTKLELAWAAAFTLVASLALLLPLVAVAIRRERVIPLLEGRASSACPRRSAGGPAQPGPGRVSGLGRHRGPAGRLTVARAQCFGAAALTHPKNCPWNRPWDGSLAPTGGPILKPAPARQPIGHQASNHSHARKAKGVAEGPMQLGHVFKIHAINSGHEGEGANNTEMIVRVFITWFMRLPTLAM